MWHVVTETSCIYLRILYDEMFFLQNLSLSENSSTDKITMTITNKRAFINQDQISTYCLMYLLIVS